MYPKKRLECGGIPTVATLTANEVAPVRRSVPGVKVEKIEAIESVIEIRPGGFLCLVYVGKVAIPTVTLLLCNERTWHQSD